MLLARVDEKSLFVCRGRVSEELCAALPLGPLALFQECVTQIVLGPCPVEGKLLARTDEESLCAGRNRVGEQLCAALPLGPCALLAECAAQAVLGQGPAQWKLLARVDEESLFVGLHCICEELSAARPVGPRTLNLECVSQVVLGHCPVLWKLLARADLEGLTTGQNGLVQMGLAGGRRAFVSQAPVGLRDVIERSRPQACCLVRRGMTVRLLVDRESPFIVASLKTRVPFEPQGTDLLDPQLGLPLF